MDVAIGEDQREGDVVGGAFGAQIVQHREIIGTVWIIQMTPQQLSGAVDGSDWAVAELGSLHQFPRSSRYLHFRPGLPAKAAAHDVRVRRRDEHGGPPQRYAALHQPRAQFRQYVFRADSGPRAVFQPLDDGSNVAHGGCLCSLSGAILPSLAAKFSPFARGKFPGRWPSRSDAPRPAHASGADARSARERAA